MHKSLLATLHDFSIFTSHLRSKNLFFSLLTPKILPSIHDQITTMASGTDNDKLVYVMNVLAHTELPQPDYKALAAKVGQSNANNA